MKGRILLFLLLVATPLMASGQTFEAGEYRASVNVNIRSFAGVGNNLIGRFLQDETVEVVDTIGNWCRVKYRNYSRAYSYCTFLTKTQGSITPQTTVPLNNNTATATTATTTTAASSSYPSVEMLLTNIETLLGKDNFGASYINDSYWLSRQKALAWQKDAMLSNFYYKLSSDGQPICSFTFSSQINTRSNYRTSCLDPETGEVNAYESFMKTALSGFPDPSLLFQDFIGKMLDDQAFVTNAKETFGDKGKISAFFRLYLNSEKQLIWEGVFVDSNSGKTISMQYPAK